MRVECTFILGSLNFFGCLGRNAELDTKIKKISFDGGDFTYHRFLKNFPACLKAVKYKSIFAVHPVRYTGNYYVLYIIGLFLLKDSGGKSCL
jgi:hypothetical protein